MEVAELETETGVSKSSTSVSESSKQQVIQNGGESSNATVEISKPENEEKTTKSVKIEDCPDDSSDGENNVTTSVVVTVNKKIIVEQKEKSPEKNDEGTDEDEEIIEEIVESESEVESSEKVCVVQKPVAEAKTEIPSTNNTQPKDDPIIETKTNSEGTPAVSKPEPVIVVEEPPQKQETIIPITKNTDTIIQTAQPITKTTTNETKTDIETITEVTQSIKLSPQQVKVDSDIERPTAQPALVSAPEAVTAAPSIPSQQLPIDGTQQIQLQEKQRQDNINNTLKEIISDIDRVIEQEDGQQQKHNYEVQQEQRRKEQQRLDEQQRLAQQLQYQQYLNQQQPEFMPQQTPYYQTQPALRGQHPTVATKTVSNEESRSETGYVKKNESYEVEEHDGFRMARSSKTTVQESHSPMYMTQKEQRSMSLPYWKNQNTEESSSTISKRVDLQKIFTPATDCEEIIPKNRKLYASSAFYSPNLHPTVEDQVALARRISHSLSDISNHTSKGQSMYVNRKKRSVKWVHEGSGKGQPDIQEYNEEYKENENNYNDKNLLRLVMNPRGQVRDLNSVREPLSETGLLSPDRCAELVTALNAPKGRGAELFAKRRRKAEKWIVDETNAGIESPSGLIDHQQQPYKPTSPASMVPAYSDVGIHRVQLNMQQDKIQDKYSQPSLKIIKSPWEAALETGSASNAFEEDQQGCKVYQPKSSSSSSQRDLAYKPNIPQGWKAPAVVLPKAVSPYNEIANFVEATTKIEQVSSAAKKCEEITQKDEDEIIHLMTKTKLIIPKQEQQHMKTVPYAENDYVSYDSALQQLQNVLEGCEKREMEMLHEQQKLQQQIKPEYQVGEMFSQRKQSVSPDKEYESNNEVAIIEKQDENEDYVKVPVKDLISTFEQQVVAEKIAAETQIIIKPIAKKPKVMNIQEQNEPAKQGEYKGLFRPVDTEEDHQQKTTEEEKESFKCDTDFPQQQNDEKQQWQNSKELYVPKEIPLESYAPPPQTSHYIPPSSGFPVYQHPSSSFAAPIENKPYSGFPLTKPATDPYNQVQQQQQQQQQQHSFSRTPQPQKQQSWTPTLSSAHPSPVSFNPSPLPYNKLAKFEQPDPSPIQSYQTPYQQRPLDVPTLNKPANVSPTIFSSSPMKSHYVTQTSPRPQSQQFPSQDYKSYNAGGFVNDRIPMVSSVDLSNCQNFNNSARGWGGVKKHEPYRPMVVTAKPVGNLRYSDF
ncbi:uncharacterized protein LOC129920597 isoform X4 [Episyrphus balteatus]|uniref:uncharacterized protein LOC129920597 isoform X4 n=1 Tax=Episyrphus balteatus TaxID=286459 RepID=UPI002485FA6C|nr:uncharacterized protein LOC129920597 isoform X4 [Episyrphus balteatus]